ncbi:hypothetical protein [Pendulispora albinea]|uniref:Cytochrome c domain-containing protein n=1 Tax=Pendulispora albinea TaxID=2741071 RepID=A0ABZ2M0X4_9BACT
MRVLPRAPLAATVVVAAAAVFSACGSSSSDPGPPVSADAGPQADVVTLPDASPGPQPQHLSEAGLYANLATKQTSPEALAYVPSYALWSDAADKKRWIVLPAGAKIDTSDMDHWQFPIGTKLFKEFARGGRRLETRLIERIANTGKTETDYRASTFVWRDDDSDADLVTEGATNVRGTDHDVPTRVQCFTCHSGEPGKILGFSAVQLARTTAGTDPASAVTLKWLAEQGKLTHPPAPGADFSAPGDATTAGALGYLHANCGNCHNENGGAWRYTKMVLRLSGTERAPNKTELYKTTVGVAMDRRENSPYPNRIEAGHPDKSALLYRMSKRDGTPEAMPPLASKKTDATGTATVTSWIQGLK